MKAMTKKERVFSALNRQEVDRPPVANPTSVATVEMMDLVDAPFPEACRSAELNARLAATEITEFDFDAIAPYFSIIQESSAIGCEMQWEQKDNLPTVRMSNPIWKDSSDIKVPKDFLEHKDTKVIIDSIKILRKEFGNDIPIIGKTMGPWTLAYHVFGVEKFLLGTIDNPSETTLALEKLKEFTYLFGEAQIDAGADIQVMEAIEDFNTVLIGCGMGITDSTISLIYSLLLSNAQLPSPVIDADALTIPVSYTHLRAHET